MPAYTFLCNNCKKYGTGQSSNINKYNYHCFHCNRKEKVVSKLQGTKVAHKGPFNPREAMLYCKEMNKK